MSIATVEPRFVLPPVPEPRKNYLNVATSVISWLLTRDHKRIAILYLLTIVVMFVIGSFAEDLRGFAALTAGASKFLATGLAYLVPNFSALNVVSQVAHSTPVSGALLVWNTIYVLVYSVAVTSAAVLIFENRNLK